MSFSAWSHLLTCCLLAALLLCTAPACSTFEAPQFITQSSETDTDSRQQFIDTRLALPGVREMLELASMQQEARSTALFSEFELVLPLAASTGAKVVHDESEYRLQFPAASTASNWAVYQFAVNSDQELHKLELHVEAQGDEAAAAELPLWLALADFANNRWVFLPSASRNVGNEPGGTVSLNLQWDSTGLQGEFTTGQGALVALVADNEVPIILDRLLCYLGGYRELGGGAISLAGKDEEQIMQVDVDGAGEVLALLRRGQETVETASEYALLRISESGELLWSKRLYQQDDPAPVFNQRVVCFASDLLGNCYVLGKRSVNSQDCMAVARFDQYGNLAWLRYWQVSGEDGMRTVPQSIALLGTGDLAIGSHLFQSADSSDPTSFVTRIGADGELRYSRSFSVGQMQTGLESVCAAGSDDVFVYGNAQSAEQSSFGLTGRLDADGDVLWFELPMALDVSNSGPLDAKPGPAGTVLVRNNNKFLSFEPDGTVVYCAVLGQWNNGLSMVEAYVDNRAWDVHEGSIIAVGNLLLDGNPKSFGTAVLHMAGPESVFATCLGLEAASSHLMGLSVGPGGHVAIAGSISTQNSSYATDGITLDLEPDSGDKRVIPVDASSVDTNGAWLAVPEAASTDFVFKSLEDNFHDDLDAFVLYFDPATV
ncbi:hypothetical protein IT575_11590 [bacterium]|nr:hypothetical protein [bacterium]